MNYEKTADEILEELRELLRARADALELKATRDAIIKVLKANMDLTREETAH